MIDSSVSVIVYSLSFHGTKCIRGGNSNYGRRPQIYPNPNLSVRRRPGPRYPAKATVKWEYGICGKPSTWSRSPSSAGKGTSVSKNLTSKPVRPSAICTSRACSLSFLVVLFSHYPKFYIAASKAAWPRIAWTRRPALAVNSFLHVRRTFPLSRWGIFASPITETEKLPS